MARVLRIINRLNLGGPTYNASYLSKYLEPKYETLLVAGMKDESEASSEFIAESLHLQPRYVKEMYRSLHPIKDYNSYKEISKIIEEFKPDIVHTHAAKAGAVGRYAAIKAGVPVVLHTFHGHIFHSYFSGWKTKVFLNIERYLAKRSSCIIAISNEQKRELGDEFKVCDPDRIEVVPLGFDLRRFADKMDEKRRSFREQYNLDDDTIAIGIIGRLVPVKNHPLFLDAFREVLNKTNKKIHGLIIGDGEDRAKIEQHCTSLGIPFNVPGHHEASAPMTFTSWITDVDRAMAGLDIIVLTSFNEGTPVSLIEAQAANKAIVSTSVGGIKDVVLEGQTALLSKSADSKGLAENMLKLVEDDELREGFGKAGREHVMEKFHYTRLVRDMDELYTRLLADAQRR